MRQQNPFAPTIRVNSVSLPPELRCHSALSAKWPFVRVCILAHGTLVARVADRIRGEKEAWAAAFIDAAAGGILPVAAAPSAHAPSPVPSLHYYSVCLCEL